MYKEMIIIFLVFLLSCYKARIAEVCASCVQECPHMPTYFFSSFPYISYLNYKRFFLSLSLNLFWTNIFYPVMKSNSNWDVITCLSTLFWCFTKQSNSNNFPLIPKRILKWNKEPTQTSLLPSNFFLLISGKILLTYI